MPEDIHLKINGQAVSAPAGSTILKAASSVGVEIPTICYHDYCTSNGLCRICVVEVSGARTLTPACVAKVNEGMEIQTDSPRVRRARKTILEMLAASVDLSDAPDIQAMLVEYQAQPDRYPDAQTRSPEVIQDNPMYIRDYAKCILCWRCVQVCAEDAQFTYAINFSGRGYRTQIGTFFNRPIPETTCVFCGQCIGVCPTGALKPKKQWLMEQGQTTDEIMRLTRSQRRAKTKKTTQPAPEGGAA